MNPYREEFTKITWTTLLTILSVKMTNWFQYQRVIPESRSTWLWSRWQSCITVSLKSVIRNNDHYFQSGKKSFHFVRPKTEDRSDMEVVIPITCWCSHAYMVMLRLLSTGGSASLWKTRISRNVSVVLSRVWAGKSSRAVPGADTPLQQTSLMPEFLITTYPRVWKCKILIDSAELRTFFAKISGE